MIIEDGFRDRWLERFFMEGLHSKNIPADLENALFRKLQSLNIARSDKDLRSPPSNHFEKLRGKLNSWCSIRVNRKWRLIFRWDGSRGEVSGLYLDKHDYA